MAGYTNREEADNYQELFNHMHKEHGLILNTNEMDEIIRLSAEVIKKYDKWSKY